jgi:arginine utilization protein RocB
VCSSDLGKESLIKEMNEKDINEYIFLFQNLIDFSFMIGWMDETQKYLDNMGVWGKDNHNWVNRNQKIIKTDIINTIVNNLYS